jgi:hypothetical protein
MYNIKALGKIQASAAAQNTTLPPNALNKLRLFLIMSSVFLKGCHGVVIGFAGRDDPRGRSNHPA